jgi:hypothetical protein
MLHISAVRKPKMRAIQMTANHFVRALFCLQILRIEDYYGGAGAGCECGQMLEPGCAAIGFV